MGNLVLLGHFFARQMRVGDEPNMQRVGIVNRHSILEVGAYPQYIGEHYWMANATIRIVLGAAFHDSPFDYAVLELVEAYFLVNRVPDNLAVSS